MATRTEIHKALKVAQGKCYVADAGDNRGRMVTNTYAAWSPGEGTRAEFRHYNLSFEDGRYEANDTLSKVDGDAPNLAQICERAKDGVKCEWAEFEGRRISVRLSAAPYRSTAATDCYVLSTPEGSCYIDTRYVDLVESECQPNGFYAVSPLKPVAAYRGDTMVAVLMPVRAS